MTDSQFAALRGQMVEEIAAHTTYVSEQIGRDGIGDWIMEIMGTVPRHEFVPIELKAFAYANMPLPIGFGKTISQPFIIALMTDLLEPGAEDVILEIGTGLGYQAAVLAGLVKAVYSVEIIDELAQAAGERLGRLGYKNVEIKVGDGYYGWPEHGPFDKVIVTAAPDLMPPPVLGQLRAGGRMVIPAGMPDSQQLLLVEKNESGRVKTSEILPVRFSVLENGERD